MQDQRGTLLRPSPHETTRPPKPLPFHASLDPPATATQLQAGIRADPKPNPACPEDAVILGVAVRAIGRR